MVTVKSRASAGGVATHADSQKGRELWRTLGPVPYRREQPQIILVPGTPAPRSADAQRLEPPT